MSVPPANTPATTMPGKAVPPTPQNFVKSLPTSSFGSLPAHATLLLAYRNLVLSDPTFRSSISLLPVLLARRPLPWPILQGGDEDQGIHIPNGSPQNRVWFPPEGAEQKTHHHYCLIVKFEPDVLNHRYAEVLELSINRFLLFDHPFDVSF
jgi:hypothetical protein